MNLLLRIGAALLTGMTVLGLIRGSPSDSKNVQWNFQGEGMIWWPADHRLELHKIGSEDAKVTRKR